MWRQIPDGKEASRPAGAGWFTSSRWGAGLGGPGGLGGMAGVHWYQHRIRAHRSRFLEIHLFSLGLGDLLSCKEASAWKAQGRTHWVCYRRRVEVTLSPKSFLWHLQEPMVQWARCNQPRSCPLASINIVTTCWCLWNSRDFVFFGGYRANLRPSGDWRQRELGNWYPLINLSGKGLNSASLVVCLVCKKLGLA